MIKLGILALGKLSWSIQVDLKYNHKCPYKRGAKGDLTTKDGIGDIMLKVRCWRVQGWGHNQGMQEASRNWKKQGRDSTLQPPGEISLADNLILSQWTPEL